MCSDMKIDTDDVLKIDDPLERALAADAYMNSARKALTELKSIRIAAIRVLARTHTGAKAAEMLNIARPSLYRAIRDDKFSSEIQGAR